MTSFLPLWQVWVILAVLLAVGEIFTTGFFLLWFALAALAAALAAAAGLVFGVQVAVFAVVAAALVLATRPLLLRFVPRRDSPEARTNLEALVGRRALVVEPIRPGGTGLVRLDGEVWSAFCEEEANIEAGAWVLVDGVEGVRLRVWPETASRC